MSSITSPNVAMLPMQDIAEALNVQYNIATRDDLAPDTEKVADVDAELIATIAPNQTDRNVVEYALKLKDSQGESYTADEFMKSSEGEAAVNFVGNASSVYSKDLNMVRDELYQMKAELIKKGFLNNVKSYYGFNDMFMLNDIKYTNGALCVVQSISSSTNATSTYNQIVVDDIRNLYPNDYIAIKTNDQNTVAKILSINDITKTITLVSPIPFIAVSNISTDIIICKTLGQYNNGTFAFSKIVESAIGDTEKYTMFNDDKNPVYNSITTGGAGYTAAFNIPSTIISTGDMGALSKFIIRAKSLGYPGNLMCYVIEQGYMSQLRGYQAALQANQVIALAYNTIDPREAVSEADLEFNFYNPSSGYPSLTGGQDYCFVIEALGSLNAENKWDIKFVTGDVQKNNLSYSFNSTAAHTIIDDMYFVLVTKPIVINQETPYDCGLYTTRIKLADTLKATSAQLTLRVNREGKYAISSGNGTDAFGMDDSNITLGIQNSNPVIPATSNGIRGDEFVVIGNTIRTAKSVQNQNIVIDQGVWAKTGDPVYRIGYKIFLKPITTSFNVITGDLTSESEMPVEMNLVAVLPDSNLNNSEVSDRLVFESVFSNDVNYNEFEIQIVWNTYAAKKGQICDLNLVFDKSI